MSKHNNTKLIDKELKGAYVYFEKEPPKMHPPVLVNNTLIFGGGVVMIDVTDLYPTIMLSGMETDKMG